MLRILIAEDSQVIQRTLKALLEDEEGIQIVGLANDGEQAVEMTKELRPDLVTMDIFMPRMDGLEATRKIMAECPTRIVIISAMVGGRDVNNSFEAMRAGAIEVIEKPHGVLAGNYSEVKYSLSNLLRKIGRARPKAQMSWMAEHGYGTTETAVRRRPKPPEPTSDIPLPPTGPPPATRAFPGRVSPDIVCIGGSTGAPTVLVEVLGKLPADYPYPVVVAQHIARGFAPGLASWLNSSIGLTVRLAERGDRPTRGTVLVAPDDHHLQLGAGGKIRLLEPANPQHHIPSIDMFFKSAATTYGDRTLAVILSGMGRDGAAGMKALYNAGAATLAQNEATSVVYGMAKVAVQMGSIMRSVSPVELSELLVRIGR